MNREKEMTYTAPSWDHIQNLSFELYMMIKKSSFKPDIMAGVSRGGLVPARILSDLYLSDKKKVTLAIMQIGFYSGINKTKKEPIIYQDLPGHIYGKRILLIDDVADSGVSLQFALQYLQMKKPLEIVVGTLYFKPWSLLKPQFYVEETSAWIVFPHECFEFMNDVLKDQNMNAHACKEFFVNKVGINEQAVRNFLKLKEIKE
ncbi:MAG: phosphoribosyltransferase [Candidatus Heimdallarchaeota archaeon]|nr:phosphoribosyltransferase [Candidatus Heimdallarchaeota archaeon]